MTGILALAALVVTLMSCLPGDPERSGVPRSGNPASAAPGSPLPGSSEGPRPTTTIEIPPPI